MRIVHFCADTEERKAWLDALEHHGADVLDGCSASIQELDLKRVVFAVVWKPPPGLLVACPGLKAVQSLGAGVDNILQPGCMPEKVPLARIVRRFKFCSTCCLPTQNGNHILSLLVIEDNMFGSRL
jgi:glyoxylate/hydroxypyruvate reductase